ncbi:WYL domain-containing protein [soil metagenome]
MDQTNPTVRSLRCLELLQDHPGITADELGRRLGVSDRAARRYVSILREAGLPIDAERGRYGGYRLGRGLRLRPLMFTGPEALSLVMAVLEGGHPMNTDDAADDPVQTALGKILRVLPESLARPAEAIRRVSTRKRGDGEVTPLPETTALLVEACGSSRRVRVDYRLGQNTRPMELDPWAVVVRYGRWYLLCWSHTSEARRALRIDRMVTAELGEETFVPPEGLDAVAELDAHLTQAWSARVVVEIDAPLAEAQQWVPHQLGRLEADGTDRTRLVGSTDDLQWYAGHLTAIDADYRILEPRELNDTARAVGERLLEAAGNRSTPPSGQTR